MSERSNDGAQALKRKCDFSKAAAYFTLLVVVGYACAAALGTGVLIRVDKFVSPIVDGLRYIGLGVVRPSIDGVLPVRFYVNLVGLAIWSALAYCSVIFVYMICNKSLSKVGFDAARRRLISTRGWSPIRAWWVLHAIVYFGVLPLAVFWGAALLNGSHGWFVFHTRDLLASVLTTLVFVFPGAFVPLLAYVIISYIIQDMSKLLSLSGRGR